MDEHPEEDRVRVRQVETGRWVVFGVARFPGGVEVESVLGEIIRNPLGAPGFGAFPVVPAEPQHHGLITLRADDGRRARTLEEAAVWLCEVGNG